MATKQLIDEFFSLPAIALVGASNTDKRFGHLVYKTLKSKSINVLPVNPKYREVDGDRCYPDVSSISEKVNGAIIITSPKNTDSIISDIIKSGVKYLWIQQGSETARALELAQMNNLKVITKNCIIMHAEPVAGFHKFHRSLWKILGMLYK